MKSMPFTSRPKLKVAIKGGSRTFNFYLLLIMACCQSTRLQTLGKENVPSQTHDQGKRKMIWPTCQHHSTCPPLHHLSPAPDPAQLQESPMHDSVQLPKFSLPTVRLQEFTPIPDLLPRVFSPTPDPFPASPQARTISPVSDSNSCSQLEIRNLKGMHCQSFLPMSNIVS